MSDILKSLKEIVGERSVSNTPEELWFYSRDPGVLAPHLPDYVVAPKTTEQVQKVVHWPTGKRYPSYPWEMACP